MRPENLKMVRLVQLRELQISARSFFFRRQWAERNAPLYQQQSRALKKKSHISSHPVILQKSEKSFHSRCPTLFLSITFKKNSLSFAYENHLPCPKNSPSSLFLTFLSCLFSHLIPLERPYNQKPPSPLPKTSLSFCMEVSIYSSMGSNFFPL